MSKGSPNHYHRSYISSSPFRLENANMTSPQRQTALAFLDTFRNLDVDANLALRAPDCVHQMGPASLGYSPDGMNNDQFGEHFRGLQPLISHFPVAPKQIFHSPGSNIVTIWATSEAQFQQEAMDDELEWEYHGEYLFVFTLNQTGDRIQHIVEYLDSQKVVQVSKLLKRAKENVQKAKRG